MAHGYVTEEFQVTDERLGVYLPTEHIDNPKGYADGKDARQFDHRLRAHYSCFILSAYIGLAFLIMCYPSLQVDPLTLLSSRLILAQE
ncbi:hypothetical protein CF319_g9239 [Tilletia indica]|nr:hypothetical protein CF319_g9239 [Tilletia indica]